MNYDIHVLGSYSPSLLACHQLLLIPFLYQWPPPSTFMSSEVSDPMSYIRIVFKALSEELFTEA